MTYTVSDIGYVVHISGNSGKPLIELPRDIYVDESAYIKGMVAILCWTCGVDKATFISGKRHSSKVAALRSVICFILKYHFLKTHIEIAEYIYRHRTSGNAHILSFESNLSIGDKLLLSIIEEVNEVFPIKSIPKYQQLTTNK